METLGTREAGAVTAYRAGFEAQDKMLKNDATELSNADLISLIFGLSVKDSALFLRQLGSFRAIVDQSLLGGAVGEFCNRLLKERMERGDLLEDPDAVRAFLSAKLRDKKAEVFSAIFLDNRHRVIEYKELFFGTINSASVYPREVVREAIRLNASVIIFAHNHPSGIAEQSQSDERITQKLVEALALIDVRVLDHFVIGDQVVSFSERGLL